MVLLYKSGHTEADEHRLTRLPLETSAMLPVIHQQSEWKPLSILLN